MEDNTQKQIRFALDSRRKRRRRIQRQVNRYPKPTIDPNVKQEWFERRSMKEQKKDKRYHFGTQLGYQYKWDESRKQFYRTGRARKLPIHGPINWDQLWPEWDDVGEDFTQDGSETDPLTEVQNRIMNDECDMRVSEWTQQLGVGSFGEVWEVKCQRRIGPKKSETENPENHVNQWDVPLPAACKLMRLNPKFREMGVPHNVRVNIMLRDIHGLRYFQHENIVQMIDFIAIPDSRTHFPYSTLLILMELCDGTLAGIGKACNSIIPLEVCYKWMKDIAQALVYMHEKNMTHMDIKPGNILFKWATPGTGLSPANLMHHYQTMTFKLGDFGWYMSFIHDEPAVTKEVVGTVNFLAPEMLKMEDQHPKDRVGVHAKPCDIYSMGATLLRCRMTANEYRTLRMNDELRKELGSIIFRTKTNPNISQNLARFILTMIRLEWAKRPTIEQVLHEVSKLQ